MPFRAAIKATLNDNSLLLPLPPSAYFYRARAHLPQQTTQSEHLSLALPGKAAVYIEVHAPSHFLVDLKAMSEAAKTPAMKAGRRASSGDGGRGRGGGGPGGGGPGGDGSQQSVEGDGGTSRLVDFLITVQQVSVDHGEGDIV